MSQLVFPQEAERKQKPTDSEQREGIQSRDPGGAPEGDDLIQTAVQLLQLRGASVVLKNMQDGVSVERSWAWK